ncbi:MAG: aminotransferase class III-fold pyridoxal phosphate-dependent enzyme [Solirubrobacteraceae bacterium]
MSNRDLYERARLRFPGGSSRTTLASVLPPPYAMRGAGAIVVDADGHETIDLHGDYSALIHGNAYAPVLAAARAALEEGSAFGLPTAAEVDLADCLAARIGWAERWRFTGSGSEAVMAAVRGARAASGREKVVRFADCYHGGWDALAKPGARGVPEGVRREVLTLPFADPSALVEAMDEHDGQVACVLLDLMPNRAGLRPLQPSFAQLVRSQTRKRGVALIVDEVITFRMAPGGMQELCGIEADIVTLGKLIGGGLPVGALGGRSEWMDVFDPSLPDGVALAGTFAANPVSMRAGLAALQDLDVSAIERIGVLGERLRHGLASMGYEVTGAGSLCKLHFTDLPDLWRRLYGEGVLIAADGLVSVSTAMDEALIDHALELFGRVAAR